MEEEIARHFSGLTVTVGSAELIEGQGIKVRGVSVIDPETPGPSAELVHVEEAFVCCRADLNGLVAGLDVSRVVLRRPSLRATRLADGTWNVAKLLRTPESASSAPPVWIESGTVEIHDLLKGPAAPLWLRDVNLEVLPSEELSQPGFGPGTLKIYGTLSGDFFRKVEIEGLVDPDGHAWTASGSIEELDVSPELRGALPPEVVASLPLLDSLRGRVALGFRAGRDGSAESPVRFDVAGQLTRGRFDDPRLLRPLTDLEATFRADNEGVSIQKLSGSSGPSTLRVKSFRLSGYDLSRPMELDAQVRNLELDPRLREILPEEFRPEWDKFLPAGKIHADVKLSYDGRHWSPELTVKCVDAALVYHKFPYPLQHVEGTVEWKGDEVTVDLLGDGGGRPVRVWGKVFPTGPESRFWIKVTASEVPLDDKVFQAIPEKSRPGVRALAPRGSIDVYSHVYRDVAGETPHKHLSLTMNDGWIRYEKFPYPVGNISGTIERNDDRWDFRDFAGTNGTGRISCHGGVSVRPEGKHWEFNFSGAGVPLDEELRTALGRPDMQQLWSDLRLRGMVKKFSATVVRLPHEEKAKLTFLEAHLDEQTTSIEPEWFPYEMKNIKGALIYDGNLSQAKSLGRIESVHGRTTMGAAVVCDFQPDGNWRLLLDDLSVDRLVPDRELIAALPGRLKGAAAELKPSGPLNLTGSLELARGAGAAGRFTSRWNLEFIVYNGTFDVGVKLENVNGGVALAGWYDGQTIRSRGELDIDSVRYNGVQLTRLLGPIAIDNDHIRLGKFVEPAPNQPARTITAQLFGGTFSGSGSVLLGSGLEYRLHATVSDGSLGSLARELMPGHQDLRGRIGAAVRLEGKGRSLNGLGGAGLIELRDADIYELPLVVALLKIFSIQELDQTAFTTSDIEFHIHGGHIYLPRIDFGGDALSLAGDGAMDFDSSIQLTFRSHLGRPEWQWPVFRELLGGAGEQLMVIHVGGTLDNPVQYREPFPGLQEALRNLQEEVQRTTGQTLFPPAVQRVPSGTGKLPRRG